MDRRLETLTGPSGRLRDPSASNIIRVLRLFNLCDVDPLPAHSPPKGASADRGLPPKGAPVKGRSLVPDVRQDPMPSEPTSTVRVSPGDPAMLQGPEEPSAKQLLEPSAVPQVGQAAAWDGWDSWALSIHPVPFEGALL